MTEPIIIKKYANRRLYNTDTSAYITLEELGQLVREGKDFEVVDAKTGDDLTRAILTQIVFEEEAKGAAMLPVSFLRQLISYYDNSMQTVLPYYLDMAMQAFIQNQSSIQEQTNKMMGSFSPFNPVQNMQEIQRRNLEQMQKVMGLFNPFFKQPTDQDKAHELDKDALIAELSRKITKLEAELADTRKGK